MKRTLLRRRKEEERRKERREEGRRKRAAEERKIYLRQTRQLMPSLSQHVSTACFSSRLLEL